MRFCDVSRYDKIELDRNYEDIFQFILQSEKTKLIVDLVLVVRASRRFVDKIDFLHTIFDLEIILCVMSTIASTTLSALGGKM